MALIKCPECGRENVSDSAEMCPGCGFGIKKYFEDISISKRKEEQEKIEAEKLNKIKRQAAIKNAEEIEKKKNTAQYKIKKMENDISERKKRTNIYVLITVLSSIVTIILYIISFNTYDDIYIKFFSMMFFVAVFLVYISVREYLLLKSAKENFDIGEKVLQSLENGNNINIDILDKNPTTGFENISANGFSYIGVSCPICHSANVKRISTANRVISIGTVGLASGKIGKQYQCKNCKHMW